MIMYNVYDEYNRLKSVNFITSETAHYDITDLSYLCARNIMKRGDPEAKFGLELLVDKDDTK